MSSPKPLFSAAPEGTVALIFNQLFSPLGFAVLYSTLVSVFTKTESPASLDRLAFSLTASRRKVRTCEPLYATKHLPLIIEAIP